MREKKITVRSLLTEDNKKHIAELLLNNEIEDLVVIYRKGNDLCCDSTEEAIATTIGMIEMAKTLVMNDWQYSQVYGDDDSNCEEDIS